MSDRSLRNMLSYLPIGAGLAGFIYRPCTLEVARDRIRRRLAKRERLFLQMVREAIWPFPESHYTRLLRWAGWSEERLAASVAGRGLEGTLEALRERGVYITHDEFKGRCPIQRGELVLEVTPTAFDNPNVVPAFEVASGGTRSQGSRVAGSFQYVAAQRTPSWRVTLEALGAGMWPAVIWMPSIIRGGGLLWWLALAHMNWPLLRWFSITPVTSETAPRRHQNMFHLGRAIGMTRGLRLPYPEHVPLSAPEVVLDVVVAARRRHGHCLIITSPSAATRLAQAAEHRGVGLEEVALLVGGEPLTKGKHAEIVRTGARVGTRYNITEVGTVGGCCGNAEEIDEVHFQADTLALITDRRTLPDGEGVDAFMLSSILPSSPKILLNVDIDDFGRITRRPCGCPFDQLGLDVHLSRIRSFSKLTGEGTSILGTDLLKTIEEVLPREFGGRSTHYQLVEAEDEHHLTRLYLLVSPQLGRIDEGRLRARFVEELLDTPRHPRSLLNRWLQDGTIQVVRREPIATAHGKLLPFHTLASTPDAGPIAPPGARAPGEGADPDSAGVGDDRRG